MNPWYTISTHTKGFIQASGTETQRHRPWLVQPAATVSTSGPPARALPIPLNPVPAPKPAQIHISFINHTILINSAGVPSHGGPLRTQLLRLQGTSDVKAWPAALSSIGTQHLKMARVIHPPQRMDSTVQTFSFIFSVYVFNRKTSSKLLKECWKSGIFQTFRH